MSRSRGRKLFEGFLLVCLLVLTASMTSLAAEKATSSTPAGPYTYTVTFYAGNQGTFSEKATEKIQIVQPATSSTPVKTPVKVVNNNKAITITGLQSGAQVTFDDIQGTGQGAPVTLLDANGQYSVRGLRMSGYDNKDEDMGKSSFTVSEDRDYVVAYRINKNMVPYEVRYQDADGNTLAPSRTYYGNVGERMVVAYLYIEGYQPQAYNLRRELTENPANNVFTFVYTPVGAGGTTVEVLDGGTTVVQVPGGAADAGGAGAGGGAGGAGAGDAGAGAEELPDEEVPLAEGPEELVDLDDEDVPLAFGLKGLDGTTNMLGAVVVSASGIAALLALIIIVARRRKRAALGVIDDKLEEDK